MFLYCDNGLHDRGYIITPDENGHLIQHQYGCVGCYQFEVKGHLEIIEDSALLDILEEALGCDYWSPEVISLKTGLDVAEVLSEALCRLSDGRYIAINNCD